VVETAKKRLAVYDGSGRRLAAFAGTWAAWSPDGRTLTTLTASGALSVRAGGTGRARPVGAFDVGFQKQDEDTLEWIGNTTIAVSDGFTWRAVDPTTERTVQLPRVFAQSGRVVSADGREAAVVASGTTTSTLEVQTRGARAPTVVQTHATCGFESPYDDARSSTSQAAPTHRAASSRSLPTAAGCAG
jgi:hypothetical protein